MIKDTTKIFRLAASYTIGSHILPGEPIYDIGQKVNSKITLKIIPCDVIIKGVKEGEFDLGLIESPIFDDALIYKEWMEDELVICSKNPLPISLGKDELNSCRLICRKEGSLTREVITDFLQKVGLSYESFWSLSEIDNATAAIQSVKWSKPNKEHPTVAIVSQLSIEYELNSKTLYQSRICNQEMNRKFYLIYNRENFDKAHIHEVNEILESIGKKVEANLLAS